jgi:hypothetical protein
MCARSKTDEINTSAVQNKKQSRGLKKLTQRMMQEEAECNSHVAKTRVGPCTFPETNTTFSRDILAIVTEKQRAVVWAVYDRIAKWQQTKSYK